MDQLLLLSTYEQIIGLTVIFSLGKEESIDQSLLLSSYERIMELIGIFSLGKATSVRERKLNSSNRSKGNRPITSPLKLRVNNRVYWGFQLW